MEQSYGGPGSHNELRSGGGFCFDPSAVELNGILFVVVTALENDNFKILTKTYISRNYIFCLSLFIFRVICRYCFVGTACVSNFVFLFGLILNLNGFLPLTVYPVFPGTSEEQCIDKGKVVITAATQGRFKFTTGPFNMQ